MVHLQRAFRGHRARRAAVAATAAIKLQRSIRRRRARAEAKAEEREVKRRAVRRTKSSSSIPAVSTGGEAQKSVAFEQLSPRCRESNLPMLRRAGTEGSLYEKKKKAEVVVEEVEEEVEEEEPLPKFIPLPGLLVFPNVLILSFWLFNTGLVKNSVSLLCWQTLSGSHGTVLTSSPSSGQSTEVDTDGRRALATTFRFWRQLNEEEQVQRAPECGRACTVLAVSILACVASVLALGLTMILHFWCRFRKTCWKPTKPAEKPTEVGDPIFRAWSQMKSIFGWMWRKPPRKPTPEEIHDTFGAM